MVEERPTLSIFKTRRRTMHTQQSTVEEFICPICLEGDNGEPRRPHPCGLHEYHLMCLVNLMRTDRRCALCRRTTSPDQAVAVILPAVTYRHVTSAQLTCAYCQNNLVQNHSCFQINACHHRLHVYCFNQVLLAFGITSMGAFHCPQCNAYI